MTRAVKILMVALVLSVFLPGTVLAQGDPTPLSPFVEQNMGFSGLAPLAWTNAGQGVFQRVASPTDVSALIQQAAMGVSADQIAASLMPRLGQTALPEDVVEVETAAATWNVYRIDLEAPGIGPVVVDLALYETPYGTYLVILQTAGEEYDALHETMFMPVLEAFTPFSLNWAQAEPLAFAPVDEPLALVPEVLDVRPHDAAAYTQGLLLHEGLLYESAGRYGFSTLREVDPASGEVLRSIDIAPEYFAEGLALVDERLIQITWKENEAFVYDRATFELLDTFSYEGEGWGLCYDGTYLYMSNGSPFITIRDPQTFDVIDRGLVNVGGRPANSLNELECVGDSLYANVYRTDLILQIDKATGNVTALIDAAGLLEADQQAALASDEVLNGIVYLPDSDTFLITGKHWPSMFEVQFVEAEAE